MYNVLEKLRSGEPLTDKERAIHEQGLVSVLKQIHDDLDAAVFDAYGWPRDLADDEILRRLVDLNRERAAEEARGLVRWLRPEFQAPDAHKAATQTTLPIAPDDEPATPAPPAAPSKKQPWPRTLPEQAAALRASLASHPSGLTASSLASLYLRAPRPRLRASRNPRLPRPGPRAGRRAVCSSLSPTLPRPHPAIGTAQAVPTTPNRSRSVVRSFTTRG